MSEKVINKKEENKSSKNELGYWDKFCGYLKTNYHLNMTSNDIESELSQSFQELVINKGYLLDEYIVYTEDGYSLQLFRIKGYKNEINNENKKAVFLQHGLLDSSDGWICNFEKNCIPYILCKKGFDV